MTRLDGMRQEEHIIAQVNRVEHAVEQHDGDWTVVSQPLGLASIENLRDMGGIRTRGGRLIRDHMLLRSANLHKASEQDLQTLDTIGLRHVIDLRTSEERHMEEDHLLPDWQYHWLPVFTETREFARQMKGIVADPGTFIESIYPQMITSDQAVTCWRHCFALLLDEPGTTLWHCTQGKDRTGGLAALILASLDVPDELIVADYLETNLFMPAVSPKLERQVRKLLGPRGQGDLNQFLIAAPAYMRAFMHAADQYGGLRGFLRERVGLTDADVRRLRDLYTRPGENAAR